MSLSDECVAGRHDRCRGCACAHHGGDVERAAVLDLAAAYQIGMADAVDLWAHFRSSPKRTLPGGTWEPEQVRLVRLTIELGWRPCVRRHNHHGGHVADGT